MTIIKDMMNKIQTDHKEFLEHNEKMQEQMRYVQVAQQWDVLMLTKLAGDYTEFIQAFCSDLSGCNLLTTIITVFSGTYILDRF